MAYTGPVRFYIVHGAGIYPSAYVQRSPFAIKGEDWRSALPEMARKYPQRGESLEIDCHGIPGALELGPEVNFYRLYTFADGVRKLVRPNGIVEFLACNVANYNGRPLIERWKNVAAHKADLQLLLDWSAYLRWHWEDSDRGRGADGRPERDRRPPPAVKPNPESIVRLALATQEPVLSRGSVYPSWNGPLFCSRAAQAFRCTVRASMAKQPAAMTSDMGVEEFLNTPDYSVMPTGSWKGHVFDFGPNGSVRYVGYNVPRGAWVPLNPNIDGPVRRV